jgi:hypothetical protein
VPGAGWFRGLQLEIHNDRLLAIPHHDRFARLIRISIDLAIELRRRRGTIRAKLVGASGVTDRLNPQTP